MRQFQIRNLSHALVAAILALALLGACVPVAEPIPAAAPPEPAGASARGSTGFDSLVLTGGITVPGAAAFNGGITADTNKFTVADTTGNTTVGGTLQVTGNTTFGALTIRSSGTFTPTAGQVLTPTLELYQIASSGAVSMTLAACANTGQMLYLVGKDNNNVTVNDTNVYTHDGSAEVFGQYDVVPWVCVSTKWHELAPAADS